MAFDLRSWSQKGRNYGRGAPPPRGSIEWIAVGDMWEKNPPRSSSGFDVLEIKFTEIDAANRWMKTIDDSVKYARKIHGDKVLSKEDETAWTNFMTSWLPFADKLNGALGVFRQMSSENKQTFASFLNESRRLHDRFVGKGMTIIPVPYMGELVALLRSMPKKMSVKQMHAKLEAGLVCGEKLLDENMPWWGWRVLVATSPISIATSALFPSDAKEAEENSIKALKTAISEARSMASIYSRSLDSDASYGPGDPVYDEFLRRLTRIWIEAAGLYGVVETKKTARAEAYDEPGKTVSKGSNLIWLLVCAGAGYLGVKWVFNRPKTITVAVPDAYQGDMR
jgi:hypothetical protein